MEKFTNEEPERGRPRDEAETIDSATMQEMRNWASNEERRILSQFDNFDDLTPAFQVNVLRKILGALEVDTENSFVIDLLNNRLAATEMLVAHERSLPKQDPAEL